MNKGKYIGWVMALSWADMVKIVAQEMAKRDEPKINRPTIVREILEGEK